MRDFILKLGPGLIFAGAAIGVSHLIQSTRAGAEFGLILIPLIILANVIKIPFFEFGTRYSASTNQNLVQGYKQLGQFPFLIFVIFTLLTFLIIEAAVILVTAGLAEQLFKTGLDLNILIILLFIFSISILLIGKYHLLDKLMKILVTLMGVFTLVAVCFAIASKSVPVNFALDLSNLQQASSLGFIIALIGWMPAPIEVSVMSSIWVVEKTQQAQSSFKDKLFDFYLGYIVTAIMAILFTLMGALILYGQSFPNGAVGFSVALVSMYTQVLGENSWLLISICAFSVILSTNITLVDAYPRVLEQCYYNFFNTPSKSMSKVYWAFMAITVIGSTIIVSQFKGDLKAMVDFATKISFIVAPFMAWLNLKLVCSNQMQEQHRPSKLYIMFSKFSLLTMVVFTIYYISHIL
ncbi:MAG: divalent metal cation transporter [Candidatus Cloacimonetes bacterium]|nr:divalent metal cation transporter [Candidatus Cloacimonadota bacterium]